MANEFKYYQSGICQGIFSISKQQITYAPAEGQVQPLTTDIVQQQLTNLQVDPLELFKNWQDIIENGFNWQQAFQTEWGASYQPTTNPHFWIQRLAKPAVNLIIADQQLVGFQMAVRNKGTVLIKPGFEKLTVLKAWQQAGLLLTHPQNLAQQKTVMVPMADGTKLATEIFWPSGEQHDLSTILVRTPYGRQMFYQNYFWLVQHGYVVIIQDVRGRNDSEGEWVPMSYERDDGRDTIEWIARQAWSNQKVGMLGGSYGGYVQWAAASSGTPYLKALVSLVTAGGPFTDTMYRNGALISGSIAWFFATDERYFDPQKMVRQDWDKLLKIRPITKIPEIGLGHAIAAFDRIMQHRSYDQFWQNMDWKVRADQIKVPALIQSGWFDDDSVGTTEAIRATDDYQPGQRKIILGPWEHSGNSHYDLGPVALGENALRFDIDLQHLRWFDHFLRDVDNGIDQEPPVEYYTLNADQWHTSATFPPRQEEQTLYLDAAKSALVAAPSPDGATKRYQYDPQHPAPQLIDVSANELEFPNDYQQVEQRSDVITFTTAPLVDAQTITGWFKVIFYASSSAVNTDWVVRLTDVTPTGESINLADGAMNAMFHAGLNHRERLVPGQIYRFEIETQKTSVKLLPGHALRLDITSSAANLIFPNSNTLAGVDSDTDEIAEQTIYTGKTYPSQIIFTESAADPI